MIVAVTAFVAMTWQIPAAGQSASAANARATKFVPPKTAWGDPDLQGYWLPGGGGMMEAPAGQPFKSTIDPGTNSAFADFFPPEQTTTAPRPRTPPRPMIVDPPDGKVPLTPSAMEKRTEIVANQDKVQFLDPRVRCQQSGVPRANLPVGYNTYQFLQIPGYVVLLYEWNHMSRYIPLDNRPHIDSRIRLPMGDSRGHWDGNTLVVDVTNFTDRTWVVGHGAPPEGAPASSLTTGHGVFHTEALHVIERFTLIDADTIHYEATVEDPSVFTRPWKIEFNAFTRAPADHQLFEYACHEGNTRNIKMLTGYDLDKGLAGPASQKP